MSKDRERKLKEKLQKKTESDVGITYSGSLVSTGLASTASTTITTLGSTGAGTYLGSTYGSPLSGSIIYTPPEPKKELLLIKVTLPTRFSEQEIEEQIQILAIMEEQLQKDGFTVKHYIVTSSDCNIPDIDVLYPKFKDEEPTKKEKIKSAIKVITKGYK